MRLKLAGATMLLMFAVSTLRASYDINTIMIELENREKTLNTVQFDFKQEINFIQMNNKTTVVGEALFGKAGKLRITKSSPDNQVTVSDGKKVWVYNPKARQVWEGSSKKWLESGVMPKGMVPLSNYVGDLRKNFDLSLVESDVSNEVRILAEPKKKGLDYKIELTVSTELWLPIKTFYSSGSAEVRTLLSKHQINPSTPESVFRFSVPKGTDVIPFN